MTTTAEATKGVPRHEGNSTFTPRADHNALADWVRDKVGETVDTAASLPATGNWVGRTITALDDNGIHHYFASGWRQIYSEFNDYTPTTTNVTGGSIQAAWLKTGDLVHVSIRHTLAGANFTGQVTYTLPTPHTTSEVEWLEGTVMLRDASTSTEFPGVIRKNSTTAVAPYGLIVVGGFVQFSNVSATSPFTWGVNDILTMNFSYRTP